MTFCTVGFLAKRHGVSPSTIRRWEAAGRIEKAPRTLGGHRRFRLTEDSKGNARRKVGYARVSSYDQKKDLERQMERLRAAGCDEVLSDIGSGLNCKKPGLRALLKQLLRGIGGCEADAGVCCLCFQACFAVSQDFKLMCFFGLKLTKK